MHKMGIISSPLSLQNKKRPTLWLDLEKLVSNKGTLFVTNTLDELEEALIIFKKCGVSVVAINGGDGTISHVITKAVKVYGANELPSFVPLRGGNFNVLADNLGIKTGPKRTLRRLLDAFNRTDTPRQAKLQTINVAGQIGFLYVNGSAFRFLVEFYKNRGDSFDSAVLLAKMALSKYYNPEFYDSVAHDTSAKIWVDDQLVFAHKSAAMFISTMPKMPWGLNIFPRVHETGGFECVVYHNPPRQTVTKGILDTFIRPHKSPYRSVFCGKSIKMKLGEEAGYTLDGELFFPCTGEMNIDLGPSVTFVGL
jgi:hypothetical protein